MSSEEFTKKIEECRRNLTALKKDIQYRDEQILLNIPTYTLDAEIRGQFIQIGEDLAYTSAVLDKIIKNAQDFKLTPKDIEKRKQALSVNVEQKGRLQNMYDQSLARRIPNTAAAVVAENNQKFNQKFNNQKMSKDQLRALKEKQQQQQDEVIDDLLGAVKTLKTGQGEIHNELSQQEVLLDTLETGIDGNSQDMSKARRNMMKLLDSSHYACLVIVILIQVAGIVCNLILWHN